MELIINIVGIIPLLRGKISVVTGNLFQATTELGWNECQIFIDVTTGLQFSQQNFFCLRAARRRWSIQQMTY